VPSVTLGTGGLNSSVLRGNDAGSGLDITGCNRCGIINMRFSFSLRRMYCATPLPISENAGINIQNHHPAPIVRDNHGGHSFRPSVLLPAVAFAQSAPSSPAARD
jgi:hypothetical protein